MLSKFFCYACVFFCIPALACVFFLSKAHQFTSKNTSLANVCPLPRISSGFLFVKCASRQARVSLSSISGQSDCPLIYCIIAELHFQMPSFRCFTCHFTCYFPHHFTCHFIRHFIRHFSRHFSMAFSVHLSVWFSVYFLTVLFNRFCLLHSYCSIMLHK